MRTMLAWAAVGACAISILAGVWWVLNLEPEARGFGVVEAAMPTDTTDRPAQKALEPEAADIAAEADLPGQIPPGQILPGQGILGKVIYVDPAGEIVPMAHVLVRLARVEDEAFDAHVAAASSNRRGFFRLLEVPPGDYHLLAFASGFPPRVVGDIQVRVNEEPEPILVRYGEGEAPAAAGAPTGDEPGEPAELTEEAAAAELLQAMMGSEASLRYTEMGILLDLPVLVEGERRVTFSSSSHVGSGEFGWTMEALSGEPQGPEDQNRPKPGKALIRGMATDLNTGAPLAGADMKLVGIDTNRSTSAGSDGRFRFDDVEPGEYAVTFDGMLEGSLFSPSSSNIILNASADQVLDIELRARQIIRVDGIVEGGQAEGAGMREGDMILTYDGVPVTSSAHLRELRGAAPPEKEIVIEAERNRGVLNFAIHGGTIGVYTSLVYR